jgi:polysaccharide export outer membrane protein
MTKGLLTGVLAAVLVLFSDTALLAQMAAKEAPKKASHPLAVGDRILVKIYPEDQYIKGGEMEVSSEGNIALPLIGKVSVEGKQIPEVEREIVARLLDGYFVDPLVVIERAVKEQETRAVSVLGQVKQPGQVSFPVGGEPLTLLKAISMAGGFSEIANAEKIKVVRRTAGGETQVIRANAESIISGKDPDIELQPEDVVHVGEAIF